MCFTGTEQCQDWAGQKPLSIVKVTFLRLYSILSEKALNTNTGVQ